MLPAIRKFIDSANFENAMKVTIAAAVPAILFAYSGQFQIGFAIALGAFLAYPSDIPSSLTHKVNGIIAGTLIVAGTTLLVNLCHGWPYIFYPVCATLIFFLGMIPVYGHRANMVAFSGLLALVLAFGHIKTGWEIFIQSGLVLLGGLFYLFISLLFHLIRPFRYTEQQITEALRLTSKYLKLRGDLWDKEANRDKIVEKQLRLQVELNVIHENIREVVIRTRLSSGNSERNRSLLMTFIALVEIMELALSAAFDHRKLHQLFLGNESVLTTYQRLAYNLASSVKDISKSKKTGKPYLVKHDLLGDLKNFAVVIDNYRQQIGNDDSDSIYLLTNMLHYAENQVTKVKLIESAFPNQKIEAKLIGNRDKDLEKFLSPIYYPWSTLVENLSFSSAHFRHALRLAVTIFFGFGIGALFKIENTYWILLTIVVILRPGYGLTKDRTFQRVTGTIAGGLIAFDLLFFIHKPVAIGTLTVGSMILGFSYTSTNYRIGVTFVTMYVIFLYALLSPNNNAVIELRILDTFIGATLAFLANYLLWPSWEFLNLSQHLKKSILANREYLSEISMFYFAKGDVTTNYRIARKNAFIETGNLMSSYQRMSQEPRSKQKQLTQLYEVAVYNHAILSASASLGTYIQSHKTSTKSAAFMAVTKTAIMNLDRAASVLSDQQNPDSDNGSPPVDLARQFTELRSIRESEINRAQETMSKDHYVKMQEFQLVLEQLMNLAGLSENILKTVQKIKMETTL